VEAEAGRESDQTGGGGRGRQREADGGGQREEKGRFTPGRR
jgi:hypothetical protein